MVYITQGYSLHENTPVLEHEVGSDRVTDPPLFLHTHPMSSRGRRWNSGREVVLMGFKSVVRKFEVSCYMSVA
ncbi:hypothetical protein EON65_46015 [archaeon]|nr:MAG: hypothetical protein EON65_46015 [archaeon]